MAVEDDPKTTTEDNPEGVGEEAGGSEQETLLDAVEDALGEGAEEREEAEARENEEQEEAGDQSKEEEGGETGAKKDDDAKGDEQGEDGKDKDDDPYAMPEGLNEKTQERFQKMVTSLKEQAEEINTLRQSAEQMRQDMEGYREVIKYSGATPEEFNQLIQFSHLSKSGEPEQLKQALQILEGVRTQILTTLGEERPDFDPLDAYPDLKKQVDEFDITREAALELARLRAQQQRAQQAQQQAMQPAGQETSAEASMEQRIQQGAQAVQEAVAAWEAENIDYQAYHPKLMERAQEIAKNYPPEQWAETLKLYYDALKEAGAVRQPPQKKTTRPLRPQGAGGGKAEPKDLADAIGQALDATA
ncbi:MAG TPA: hypothetical protein ENJ18_10555 [Nannocystis exedens]|nr:hypothetical protein [Nannocystis exedens]